jgi:hypothetical protein
MFLLKGLYRCLIIAYSAFVVMTLWGWFVTPTFGLAPLTFFQAMGLDIFVSFLTMDSTSFYLSMTMEYLVKEFPRLKTVQEKVSFEMTWFVSPIVLTSLFFALGAIAHYLELLFK